MEAGGAERGKGGNGGFSGGNGGYGDSGYSGADGGSGGFSGGNGGYSMGNLRYNGGKGGDSTYGIGGRGGDGGRLSSSGITTVAAGGQGGDGLLMGGNGGLVNTTSDSAVKGGNGGNALGSTLYGHGTLGSATGTNGSDGTGTEGCLLLYTIPKRANCGGGGGECSSKNDQNLSISGGIACCIIEIGESIYPY